MPASRFAACVLCFASGVALGAAPPLMTDRPGQGDSSEIVPRRHYQLEIGYGHAVDREDGLTIRTDEVPQTLLRIGVLDNAELRVGLDGLLSERTTSLDREIADESGFGDSSVGGKYRFRPEGGGKPAVGLVGTFTLPTGDADLTSDRVDPSLRLLVEHAVNEQVSVGYNLGPAWSTEQDESGDRDTLSEMEWSVAAGIAASDRIGFFVELFGGVPLSAPGKPATSIDLGGTYLIRDNLQLDTFFGVGLSSAAADWFAGLGISLRLPE